MPSTHWLSSVTNLDDYGLYCALPERREKLKKLVRPRHAFTLIEMLVVLVAISILAAVLLPVFGKVRERARQTQCLSNLHQLSQAVLLYAQDSDDHFPYGGDPTDLDSDDFYKQSNYWPQLQQMRANNQTLPNVMAGYIKTRDLWHCPDDNGFDMGGFAEEIPMAAHPSCFQAFGMSYAYTTSLVLEGQTVSGVRAWSLNPPYSEQSPAAIPLLSDKTSRIARDYGVLLEDEGVALRGLFIIDPEGVIQYSVTHNLNVGRSVDETLRVLEAIQSGGLCGSDWKPGQALAG